MPTAATVDAAQRCLAELGIPVEREGGRLYFRLPGDLTESTVEDTSGDRPAVEALAGAAEIVAAAARRLDATLPGVEHPRIAEVRLRLTIATDVLEHATHRLVSVLLYPSGTLRPAGVLLQVGLFLAVVWPATLLAAWATDRSPAWMAAAAIVSLYAVGLPIGRLNSAAETWIGRTRVTRSAPRGVDDAGLPRPLGPELERVRAAIAVARSVVGSVVRRHRKGSRGPLWIDDRDRVVRCLAEADLALRMASDAIDYWLSLPRG